MLYFTQYTAYGSLSYCRPNAYATRNLDNGSATVTANLSAGYSGATPPPEYEMIPYQSYSKLPAGKRPAQGYVDGGVVVTANPHVTSPIHTHSTENGKGSEYEVIRNVASNVHLYEMPKLPKMSDETLPEARPDVLQYAVPPSRQNTKTRSLSLSTGNGESMQPRAHYDMPRSHYNTMNQESSSSSTVTEVPPNLYNVPRSRQTQQSSAGSDITSHYDKLDKPSNIPTPVPRENEQVQTERAESEFGGHKLNTYAVPRSSTISKKPHSNLVVNDLSQDGLALSPTEENSETD